VGTGERALDGHRGSARGVVACRARSTIGAARELARVRAREQGATAKLFLDDLARLFDDAGEGQLSGDEKETKPPYVEIATRFIDDTILTQVALEETPVNDLVFRQVVVVGDASDTRAFRLPWPVGTCIYHVASEEGHRWAERILKETKAYVKRGCLMRRVTADLRAGDEGWTDRLVACGFQPDRPAVFAIQGLAELDELPLSALHALFGELAGVAAHRSVVVGELPAMRGDKAQELLAAHGFLGWPIAFGSEEAADYGRWRGAGLEAEALDGEPRRLLFRAQQTRASTYQADVIMRFRREFEDLDEDFTGNFS